MNTKMTLIFLLLISLSLHSKDRNEKIFTSKTRKYDNIGFDSTKLVIKNYLTELPVCWKFEIYLNGKVIFGKNACDTEIDSLFNDTNYVTNCKNYSDCKRKWYLERFSSVLGFNGYQKMSSGDNTDQIMKSKIESEYLKYGFNLSQSQRKSDTLLKLFKENKISVFTPTWAPEGRNEFPKIYDIKLGKFIEIFEW